MNIIINLDEPVFAERVGKTLNELIVLANVPWAESATCATQESDGEILFWSAPFEQVCSARCKADIGDGLIPILGIGNQVDNHYIELDGRDVVARDWESAVVSRDSYLESKQ
ncbi:hypothetical protein AAIA71_28600 (plasmid) [Vibrio harveyi]|uniref:hypothetical protein n=1 Tax=Vibrio harveyi TaxID=669 RepID=UPI0024814AF0|nr:hypothetical protein [Vibrio harveyi]